MSEKAVSALRLGVVLGIAAVAIFACYGIHRDRPVYVENATVLFGSPVLTTYPRAYSWLAASEIATANAASQAATGPRSASRIRAAGGTAAYRVQLINLYNLDYPDFSYPEATISVSSPGAAVTHRTFTLVTRMLNGILAGLQKRAGVAPDHQIVARIISDSGMLAESGSRKRAYVGVILLATVASAAAWEAISRLAVRGRPGPVPPATSMAAIRWLA
jgi:hypothetical protein